MDIAQITPIILFILLSLLGGGLLLLFTKINDLKINHREINEALYRQQDELQKKFHSLEQSISSQLSGQAQQSFDGQFKNLKILQDTLRDNLNSFENSLTSKVSELTKLTDNKLQQIGNQVEKRLSDSFDKTSATFTDIVKRIAVIDDAQRKLTDLSSNVVSLQEILADKRSRGAFGEVQLQSLIENMLPVSNYQMQYQFSNGKRCDCILFLPNPVGKLAIDAKFPLESYQKYTNFATAEAEKKAAHAQFKQDIKKHITDIADKYIIPNETSDGAIMFIPAEAVFAHIHDECADLVTFSQHKRVWLASPTTMMAILTTAQAVLKDAKTREQVHVIQEHLQVLAKDFSRLEERMSKLSRQIGLANDSVHQVQTSATKISSRFRKIEQVNLQDSNVSENDPELAKIDDYELET